MKKSINLASALLIVAMLLGACKNGCGDCSKGDNCEKSAVATTSVLDVDQLLANAETLISDTIKVEGICTHLCAHGATKLFLMGSDDTKTIRVEAAKLGAFDKKAVNSITTVTGVVKEDRIDESYLQKWEARVAAQTDEKHGDEEQGGCSTEKSARGEKANTVEGRIADFRTKIADRKEKDGKDYLSFYFVEAISYDVQ